MLKGDLGSRESLSKDKRDNSMFYAKINDAADRRKLMRRGQQEELRSDVLENLVGAGQITHLPRSRGGAPTVTGERQVDMSKVPRWVDVVATWEVKSSAESEERGGGATALRRRKARRQAWGGVRGGETQ